MREFFKKKVCQEILWKKKVCLDSHQEKKSLFWEDDEKKSLSKWHLEKKRLSFKYVKKICFETPSNLRYFGANLPKNFARCAYEFVIIYYNLQFVVYFIDNVNFSL